ncbi:hypothetical protein [Parasitella parasitica]|uniref:Cofilin n=1 Tax=Parasitella parasitica TaxID=35722 RepID=A0A0B7NDC8_9FUNG|nr:hypothetical protein [Parasitella parasitica]
MSSGVTVNQVCLDKYQELKIGQKYKYITFKLSDDLKEIVVDEAKEVSKDKSEEIAVDDTYNEFLSKLPENMPRFAVYDFDFEKPGEGKRNKITFYSWYAGINFTLEVPDTSTVRQKMLYASSKEALRKSLVGLAIDIQGTDSSEVSYETVLDKIERKQ